MVALVLLVMGGATVYVADYAASELLLPTVPPKALLAVGSPECAEASMALVALSGVGRQTSYEMGAVLADVAREADACTLVLDFGTVMDTEGNVSAVLARALHGRPDGAGPLPLVLLGNSAGGIEAQRMANLLHAWHADRVRVAAVVADSTPSGIADLKPPGTRDLAQRCGLPLGHLTGQNVVRLWQVYEEAGRRNEDLLNARVLSRIQANTDAMQAKLTLSQMCMIKAGYPQVNVATPSHGVPHVYVRAAREDADEVVRLAEAAATINRRLGGAMRIVQVPGGSHAAAYLDWPAYEATYREIIRQVWIDLNPPPAGTRRPRPR